MFFLNEETTVAETLEVVQEVQQDLEQLKPQCSSGNAQKLDSWSDKAGVPSAGGGADRMHRIPDCENGAENAGAEPDSCGYGDLHPQILTVGGVRDHLWSGDLYCGR